MQTNKNPLTMIRKWTVRIFCIWIALIGLSSCSEESLSPISSTPLQQEVDFLIGDPNSPYQIGDTIPVDVAVVYRGRTADTSVVVTYWEWDFGNGARDSGKYVSYKYTLPGTYNVCVKAWTSPTHHYQYCRSVIVGNSGSSSSKPIFRSGGAINVGGGYWDVTYELLWDVVRQMNCDTTQPFMMFWETSGGNRVPLNNSITSAGYKQYTKRIQNGAQEKFSFGGNFSLNCWGWDAPHVYNGVTYSNIFYVPAEAKTVVTWINGVPYPNNGTPSEPGITGDTGPGAVVRLGPSLFSQDSIVFYFNKSQVAGNSNSPFWVNSLTGMNNPMTITTASGHTDWWRVAIHKNSLPSNGRITFKFGGNYSQGSWANMNGSYYWNNAPTAQYLEAYILGVGGKLAMERR